MSYIELSLTVLTCSWLMNKNHGTLTLSCYYKCLINLLQVVVMEMGLWLLLLTPSLEFSFCLEIFLFTCIIGYLFSTIWTGTYCVMCWTGTYWQWQFYLFIHLEDDTWTDSNFLSCFHYSKVVDEYVCRFLGLCLKCKQFSEYSQFEEWLTG